MKVIDAIQEAMGPRYTTLEDALNWWAWPESWREGAWNDFVLRLKPTKTAFNLHLKKEAQSMEQAVLTAVREMTGEPIQTMEQAHEQFSRRELLDIWLRYEGVTGYTQQILNVMGVLGYDIDPEC